MRKTQLRALPFGTLVASAAFALGCGEDKPITTTGSGGMGGAGSTISSSSSTGSTSSSSSGAFPDVFTVTGIVTDGEKPVADAIVLQGGGKPAFVTGADGTFTLEMTTTIPGTPTVVASKIGYRTGGVEFIEAPVESVEIVMHEVKPPDNTMGYTYGPPGVGDADIDNSTAVCGHCHTTIVAQFNTSAHAKATKDPLVQDLYAGTSNADAASCTAAGGIFRQGLVPGTAMDTKNKCYVGGGVLADLNGCGAPNDLACDDPTRPEMEKPKLFGHCADCHAAGLPGPTGGRNLLDATGTSFDHGNHCDVCHKVSDIDLEKPPGVAGRLILQRPRETVTGMPGAKLRQVMYGPLLDVPNKFMGGSYQPKFSQAIFCAGCHEQEQDALVPGTSIDPARFPSGLPTHSTYSEWSDSAWAMAGAHCQHCHMPPNDGLTNTVDTTKPEKASITNGFVRPPEEIRSHAFRGPLTGPNRLLDVALGMWLAAEIVGNELSVSVKLSNQGAGHAVPTGEPMRSLLLVVQANACGEKLALKGGLLLDDVAGALSRGIVGQDVTPSGNEWSWSAAAAIAKPGNVIRVIRDSGQWIDYPGIGFFANPLLGPAEKGLPLYAPVGEARIVSVMDNVLTVDESIVAEPGDIVMLGDSFNGDFADGASSLALAGAAGQSFARVLVDAAGTRLVPHYKAVDIVSDNRLPPLEPVTTSHLFELPAGCPSASVTATALYRPVPLQLGRLRGWETRDWVAATRKEVIAIP
ncbi:MAG: carboxypeptidase regulatory-like domain-containing protein [Polyangiaceae bacterium]|nr:carboxypeptidase regulatory-like domain-containing protein [Polyangiaceae bacterium]